MDTNTCICLSRISPVRGISRRCSRPSTVDTLTCDFQPDRTKAGRGLRSGGKAVVKGTWGLYNYILGDTYGDVFAATATGNAVFLWHDLNNDKLWTPNETNLALNNNPDFVQITAASNYELSPELKQPNTWESTVSFERELAPSLGFRVVHQRMLTAARNG